MRAVRAQFDPHLSIPGVAPPTLTSCLIAQKSAGQEVSREFPPEQTAARKPPRAVRHRRSIYWPRWWPYCRPSRDGKELDVPGTYQAKRHSHCSHDERGYPSSHKRGRPDQVHVEPRLSEHTNAELFKYQ